jgi:hypothetical protein
MKPSPLHALRRHHRRELWTPAVWTAAAGLSIDWMLARAGADVRVRLWALGVFLGGALLVRILLRPPLRVTARSLDAKAGSRNRFEALAEHGDEPGPLPAALRAEAAEFLNRQPLPRPYRWFSGIAVLAALLVFLAVRQDFVVPAAAPAIVPTSMAAPAIAAVEKSELPKPVPMPAAALHWLSPDVDSAAAPGERVPLTAQADSGSGLRTLSLRAMVNGEERAPVALPDDVAAGVHELPATLALEGLGAAPYDIVSYYLTAERARAEAAPEWPVVFSPLQTLIVLPAGDDARAGPDDEELLALLRSVQQLRRDEAAVTRAAFALEHDLPPRSDPTWLAGLNDAATLQDSVRERASTLAAPAPVKTLLAAAGNEAASAGNEFGRRDPAAASPAAHRALTQFASAEKIVAELVRAARERLAAEAAGREQGGAIARENSPAGRLERLAAEQAAMADQLAARNSGADSFKTQDGLAREIARLAAERALPPEVIGLVASGATAARDAADQLNEQDAIAATEPATRAAQTLAEAVAKLDALGRERAAAELLAAQRAFIGSATDLDLATPQNLADAASRAGRQLEDVRRQLLDAAQREQQRGSAAAAQRLEQLAQTAGRSGLRRDLADGSSEREKRQAAEKLTDLAQRAADASAELGDAEKARERAAELLARARANLDKAAQQGDEALRNAYERAAAAAQSLEPNADERSPASRLRRLAVEQAGLIDLVEEKPGVPETAALQARVARDIATLSGERSLGPEVEKPLAAAGAAAADAAKQLAARDLAGAKPSVTRAAESLAEAVAHLREAGRPDGGRPGEKGSAAAAGGQQRQARAPRNGGGTTDGSLPPPPGPGTPLKNLQDYAGELATRIDGILREAAEEARRAKRPHVLTTANPADAPPAYRPAVADYFEALARDHAAVAPRQP